MCAAVRAVRSIADARVERGYDSVRDAVSVTRSGDGASHGSALAWLTGHVGAPEVQYLQCGAEYCVAYSVASAISLLGNRGQSKSEESMTADDL